VTYAALAAAVGTGAARAVGVALGKNPTPIVVPCHRVVAADGAGGFSAPGGTSTKAQLLAIEGGALDDETHRVARRHLARVDPALAPLVRSIPCTLPVRPNGNLFRTIVRAIAGQQLSTKAAATIFGRLEEALGIPTAPSHTPRTRWPDAAAGRILALDETTLRSVGLSGAKAASLRDLSERVVAGTLDLARIVVSPDERVIEALTAVRGIGRWTAEMLLVFDLGRPDVLPVDDLGIRKGMQKLYGLRTLPDADVVTRRAEAWRPFRSIGSWYLWRALDATPA
jgi:O-6-methylguanine DNA methyltransferase